MKIKEIRDQSNEQLATLLLDTREELFKLKNELAVNRKLEKPHLIKEKKRDIARILMVRRERKK